ncbi:MAG TPA: haloalkane dehalogenase [Acidimicrobiales bacterium]|nr:haloalkane dehalogenase [Acidimicrobiales bacterium]
MTDADPGASQDLQAVVLRTPDERFAGLEGFPYEPHYVTVRAEGVEPLRMHYVESGPAESPVVLLVHGQPTWSYMYRTVIDELAGRGLRAIAADNIGFGRSDKPAEPTDYTLERHVQWVASFVDALDLRDATLVVHDWGGPIGLSVLAGAPHRFARVVVANTVLHTADPALDGVLTWANHGLGESRVVLEEALLDYVRYCQRVPDLVASHLVYSAAGPLSPAVRAAYDAPFPGRAFTAGMRQMTGLIPLTRNDPGAAIGRRTMQALEQWDRPLLTAYSDADPATRGWETVFRRRVPGAEGRAHPTIRGAGHFVPEERGEELGRIVAEFVETT